MCTTLTSFTRSNGTNPHTYVADGDAAKPAYVREMERYKEMSCTSDDKDSNRPLVK